MEADAKRNVAALVVFNVFRGFAVGGFVTLFPMYMASIGYDMREIGSVITIGSLTLALLLPGIGAIIDYYGPRRMVALTGGLIAVAAMIASNTQSYPGLVVAYIVFLSSFFAGQPARMSFLALAVGTGSLGTYIGLTSSVFSASRTAGPAVAGVMAERLGYELAFEVIAGATIAGLVLFLALSRETGGDGGGSVWERIVEGYKRSLRPQREFAVLLAFVGLDRFAWSLWFPMLTAHLYNIGFTEAEAGLVMSVSGVIRTIAMPGAGVMVDRLGSWAGIVVGEALGVVSALMLGSGDRLLAWTAAPILGVSIAVWVPAYNKAIAAIAGGTGEAYATANTVRGLAGAPAPTLGGLLYDTLSSMAPFAFSGMLLAGATVYAAILIRRAEESRARRSGPSPPPRGRPGE